MKGRKNSTNQSLSRFLDDLDRREEERREDLPKTLKQPPPDDVEFEDGIPNHDTSVQGG
jgi:hypothetical protein